MSNFSLEETIEFFSVLNWSMISMNSVNSSLDDLRDTIHGTDMMCHPCELTTSGTTGGSRTSKWAPIVEVVRQSIIWQNVCGKLYEINNWTWWGRMYLAPPRSTNGTPMKTNSVIIIISCSQQQLREIKILF